MPLGDLVEHLVLLYGGLQVTHQNLHKQYNIQPNTYPIYHFTNNIIHRFVNTFEQVLPNAELLPKGPAPTIGKPYLEAGPKETINQSAKRGKHKQQRGMRNGGRHCNVIVSNVCVLQCLQPQVAEI